MRILLVDDDREYMPRVVEALRLKGHEVMHARNLPEVEQAMKEHPFDCIVLDLMVPPTRGIPAGATGGGYTAGRFLYEQHIRPLHPTTPFVILTAADDSVDAVRECIDMLTREPSFRGKFKKPFAIGDLVIGLDRAVAKG
jgi:two-component system OmpR family response regulator/two-component system response regulator QseB